VSGEYGRDGGEGGREGWWYGSGEGVMKRGEGIGKEGRMDERKEKRVWKEHRCYLEHI
jgi:hypothetical protein